jgi:dTMP kinase
MIGKLITIEGIDGSGKKTQTNLIKQYLESKGKKVKVIEFPRYKTEVGKVIANYLKGDYGKLNEVPNELICIAYASDRAGMSSKIRRLLNDGYYVIADRYTYSNLFTAAKLPKDQQYNFIKWIEKMEFKSLNIVKPDYNFYLYLDPEIAYKRINQRGKRDYQDGKDDIHEQDINFLSDVTECYFNIAKDNPKWNIINQIQNNKQLSKNQIFNKIKKHLDKIIKEGE